MEMSMEQPLFSASDLYVKVSLYPLITGGEQLFEGKHLRLPRLCWLIGIGGKESNGVQFQ